jgi:hypothetical protein
MHRFPAIVEDAQFKSSSVLSEGYAGFVRSMRKALHNSRLQRTVRRLRRRPAAEPQGR